MYLISVFRMEEVKQFFGALVHNIGTYALIRGQNVYLSLIIIRAVRAIGVCFILRPRNRGGGRTEYTIFSGFGVAMGLRLYYICIYMIGFTLYAAYIWTRQTYA